MPPKGKRARKGDSGTPLNPEPVLPEQEEADETPFIAKAKRKKTMSCFTEQLKEEIMEFLMNNEVLYSKSLSGFKDVTRKEELWTAQSVKMNTAAEQLKMWYTSMRTMLDRRKKRVKKSGSGGDVITDMNITEKWLWDKFSFLIQHIETFEPRNVALFAAAVQSTVEKKKRKYSSEHSTFIIHL